VHQVEVLLAMVFDRLVQNGQRGHMRLEVALLHWRRRKRLPFAENARLPTEKRRS
jgi:hypothetical protein